MPKRPARPISGPQVDKESVVAYHHQLAELLRSELQSGRWKSGDIFWGESALRDYHQVSRSVVRQAVGQLAHEGLLKQVRGIGTVVLKTTVVDDVLHQIAGFYEEMSVRGVPHRTEVREEGIRPASQLVAAQLRLEVGAQVLYLERLRFVADSPYVLVRSYVPYYLCPGIENEDLDCQSLYTVLRDRYGIRIQYARRLIEARIAAGPDAAALRVSEGTPLLVLRSFAYMLDGRVVEYHEGLHRADRVAFEAIVGDAARRTSPMRPVTRARSPRRG